MSFTLDRMEGEKVQGFPGWTSYKSRKTSGASPGPTLVGALETENFRILFSPCSSRFWGLWGDQRLLLQVAQWIWDMDLEGHGFGMWALKETFGKGSSRTRIWDMEIPGRGFGA